MIVTKNLAPVIKKDQFDRIAAEFLEKYCREALVTPMAVPIEAIARDGMGLTVEHVSITEDLSELGKIFFTDGQTEVYLKETDEYIRKTVKKGTIFIDEDVLVKRNGGCERFTLTHECVHWDLHKAYHLCQAANDKGMAVAHRCSGKAITEKTARTEEDWMEWQAEGIAAAILMPKKMFIQKADELVCELSTISSLFREEVIKDCLVTALARFFNVSEQSAKIRLSVLEYSL